MKRCIVLIVVILVIVCGTLSQAIAASNSYPVSLDVDRIMRSAIDDVIEQHYTHAFSLADSIANISTGPEAWALRAMIYQAWIIDYESFDRVDEFYRAVDSTEERANQLLNSYPAFAYLSLGLVNGFRASILLRQDRNIASVKAAISMKSALEKAITIDPTLTDCYVGLGSYDYWSSRKLNFLPFFGDRRDRGISRLKTALETSKLHSASAATALIWIYIDRGDGRIALKMAEDQLQRYPSARSFMWAAAEAAYAIGDWKVGIEYYQKILASCLADPIQGNNFNIMSCYHSLAEMYQKIGEPENAKDCIRKAMKLHLTDEIRDRKKIDLADFQKWWLELTGSDYRD